jgi:hypothetical protein
MRASGNKELQQQSGLQHRLQSRLLRLTAVTPQDIFARAEVRCNATHPTPAHPVLESGFDRRRVVRPGRRSFWKTVFLAGSGGVDGGDAAVCPLAAPPCQCHKSSCARRMYASSAQANVKSASAAAAAT